MVFVINRRKPVRCLRYEEWIFNLKGSPKKVEGVLECEGSSKCINRGLTGASRESINDSLMVAVVSIVMAISDSCKERSRHQN